MYETVRVSLAVFFEDGKNISEDDRREYVLFPVHIME